MSISTYPEIVRLAVNVIGNRQKALDWLDTPNPELEYQCPLECMRTAQGRIRVALLLRRMRFEKPAS